MHFFTSININYLPKARVLAHSLKRYQPKSRFTLVLCERADSISFDLDAEPFDQVLFVSDLDIPVVNLDAWMFTHTVVELCTAVKPFAFHILFLRELDDTVVYLDPDIKVFDNLDFLDELLSVSGVVITPHLLSPVPSQDEVITHEISCLKHGTYNLGFLAVHRMRGAHFLDWWKARLLHFCYDEISKGLFTDQRWIDLAPSLFEEVHILRDTSCNVASWNISMRSVTLAENGMYLVDGSPLKFFHFSGYDSGTHDAILSRYAADNKALKDMSKAYYSEQEANGQTQYRSLPWSLGIYRDGTPITQTQRLVYHRRPDLAEKYPDPYSVEDPQGNYIDWYRENNIDGDDEIESYSEERLRLILRSSRREMRDIKNSTTYGLVTKIVHMAKRLGIRKPGAR